MGLDKDREAIKQLQEVVLNLANMLHATQEKLKEISEDHMKLRRQYNTLPITGIPSAE